MGMEVLFDLFGRQVFSPGIVMYLVFPDLSQVKITGSGMGKIVAADRSAGVHAKVFGQPYSGLLFCFEQVKKASLF